MSRFVIVALIVVICSVGISGVPVKEETTTKAKEHSTTTTEKVHTTEKNNPKRETETHMCKEDTKVTTTTKKPHDELTHKEAIRRLRDTTHDKHPGTTTTTTPTKPYTPPSHKANVDLLKKDVEHIKCPVSKDHEPKKDEKKDSSNIYNPSKVFENIGAKH